MKKTYVVAKNLRLIFIIFSISLFLQGCDSVDDVDWNQSYNLKEVDKITIAIDNPEEDISPSKKLIPIVEVTEASEVKMIKEVINFSSWQEVPLKDQLQGVPEFYVVFDNGFIISTYSDVAYGYIMNFTKDNGFYNYTNSKGPYNMSEEFLTTIKKLLETYSEESDF